MKKKTAYEWGGWAAIALLFVGIFADLADAVPPIIAALMIIPAFAYHVIDNWRKRA